MIIDIHAHAYRHRGPVKDGKLILTDLFSTPPMPDEIISFYDSVGINKGVLLPIVSPEVYLPQSNEDILDFCDEYPGRFVPFCNIDPRALTNSEKAPLGDLLKYYKDRGCRGVGEVMPNLQFKDPLVQNLFKCVADAGLPLTFDISTHIGGTYGLYDDIGLPQLEYSLNRFPKLRIFGHGPSFWSQIGQLEFPADVAILPTYPVKEDGAVPMLMRKYPNLFADLSAMSGFNALNRDHDYAIRFLTEFQDRVFFGTDICKTGIHSPLLDFLEVMRDTGRISDEIFNKTVFQNAQKALGI